MFDPIQHSRFTTENLPPEQRETLWRDSISTLFDITVDPGRPAAHFNTTVDSYLINSQVILAHCNTTAQRFERSAFKVARDNLDYYMIQTHLSGSQVMRVGSRNVECGTGELMIIDLTEKHDAVTTDFNQLTLLLPRQLLAPLLKQPDYQQGRVLKPDTGLTRLAVQHLSNLYLNLGSCQTSDAQQIIEPTLLLMASALNGKAETVENGSTGLAASILLAAKQKIERHLQEDLTVDRLCALLGYSRSTLYRLFEPLGGVRQYVQQRRLRRSLAILLSDNNQHKRICDIAYSWGFASEAHYSRYFRQQFGIPPRDARFAGIRPESIQANSTPLNVGDRDYEYWVSKLLRT